MSDTHVALKDANSVASAIFESSTNAGVIFRGKIDENTGRVLVDAPSSGGITSINTDTTAAQTLTVGTTGTDFAIADNGTGDHKFNLPDASATARGVVTTSAQTIAGAKTFSSTIVGNISGNAATVTTNANLTGPITSSGNATAIASQTGTGTKFVVDTSPTLVTPNLGVASATSLATSAASPLLMTNGQLLTVAVTSQTTGGATLTIPDFASVSDEFVFKTKAVTMSNKTFVSPVLGAATATSINKMAITAPATSSTLAVADGKTLTSSVTMTLQGGDASVLSIAAGKTLTASNSLSLAGTDSTVMTFPSTSATIARTDAANTFTGTQTVSTLAAPTNASISMSSGTFNTIQTYSPTGGGTATLDLSKGNIHHITMPAGNITIALSNGTAGQCFIVRILQDSVGSRTVTWFTTIKWAGGSAPTLTTTASKADTLGFEITGSNTYDGFVVGQNI